MLPPVLEIFVVWHPEDREGALDPLGDVLRDFSQRNRPMYRAGNGYAVFHQCLIIIA